jgi:hypothetical protein
MRNNIRKKTLKDLKPVNSKLPELPVPVQRIVVVQGERPPLHEDYNKLKMEWDFYDSSYKGGSRYKDTKDCNGYPVLVQHTCESKIGFENRKSLSAYYNYPRAITDRFISMIFSRPVSRDENPSYSDWRSDVDGQGTDIHVFMNDRLIKAAVLGIWGVVIDSNLINPPTSKLAESQLARITLRDIDPRSCINWIPDRSEVLLKQGKQIQLVDTINVTTWKLDDEGRVEGMGITRPHGWNGNPIVWLHGCQDQEGPEASLIGDVAEHARLLMNYSSWLSEELQKATFSQFILAAPNLDQSKLANVPLGSRNWLVIPLAAQDVKWECVGADPSQSESLRASIQQEVESIYRSVGLQPPEQIRSSAESGVALQIRLSEMSNNASKLAQNAEQCENKIQMLWSGATGVEVENVRYPDPDDMDVGSIQDELNQALSVITADVPNLIKSKQVETYASKKFNKLEKKDKDELIKAINTYYTDEAVESRKQAEVDMQKQLNSPQKDK